MQSWKKWDAGEESGAKAAGQQTGKGREHMKDYTELIGQEMKKAQDLIDKRQEEIELLQQKARESEESAKNAWESMEQCMIDDDIKGYRKAKSEKLAADDAVEMYRTKLERLKEKPLITKEDYDARLIDIKQIWNDAGNAARNEIQALASKISEIMGCYYGITERTNACLHLLQHDIYKDADRQNRLGTLGKQVVYNNNVSGWARNELERSVRGE